MMSDFPSDQPRQPVHPLEIVSSKEILSARIANEVSLAREIHDRQAVFRADVIRYLGGLGAINDGIGWAVYRGNNASDVIDQGDRWHGLVFMTKAMPNPTEKVNLRIPRIRIVHYEEYRVDGGIEWMTNDLMIDEDGDAFHAVGSIEISDTGDVDPSKHTVPLFFVQEGVLQFFAPSLRPYVDFHEYSRKGNDGVVIPFGVYNSPLTKIDVLEAMKAYIEKFKSTPVHAHYSPN